MIINKFYHGAKLCTYIPPVHAFDCKNDLNLSCIFHNNLDVTGKFLLKQHFKKGKEKSHRFQEVIFIDIKN